MESIVDSSEAAVLPVIIAAFIAIGLHCIRVQVKSSVETSQVTRVKFQVAVTVSVAFTTLVLEACYVAVRAVTLSATTGTVFYLTSDGPPQFLAYANATSNISSDRSCDQLALEDPLVNAADPCSNPCRNEGSVIKQWMMYTPSFRCATSSRLPSSPRSSLTPPQSCHLNHLITRHSHHLHMGNDQLSHAGRHEKRSGCRAAGARWRAYRQRRFAGVRINPLLAAAL